ncbi:hypothetical protein PoB_007366100 [Plakobranchus ocellatus]|uniref:Uncharacterized protein n=1 Tax=Plakobranchus ocellatus TaxID=259542 RepID=A0AAV4DTE5_9GAST|nr:hypothetical protein PoB_007366100 [Plakobranchus ocellatus]
MATLLLKLSVLFLVFCLTYGSNTTVAGNIAAVTFKMAALLLKLSVLSLVLCLTYGSNTTVAGNAQNLVLRRDDLRKTTEQLSTIAQALQTYSETQKAAIMSILEDDQDFKRFFEALHRLSTRSQTAGHMLEMRSEGVSDALVESGDVGDVVERIKKDVDTLKGFLELSMKQADEAFRKVAWILTPPLKRNVNQMLEEIDELFKTATEMFNNIVDDSINLRNIVTEAGEDIYQVMQQATQSFELAQTVTG